MADEIKRVTYDVPVHVAKNTRRRARPQQGAVSKAKPVATPTIPVAQAAGAQPPVLSTTQAAIVTVPPKPAAAAATAAKKPAIKIPLPYNNSKVAAVATPVKPQMQQQPTIKIVEKPNPIKSVVQPSRVRINPDKRRTMKRKFSERKIVVKVENASKVRKTRDAIRRKVANMKLEEVTENLRTRGLIRPHVKVPDETQRGMLIDVMTFPIPV
jgi:hypothetical protein